MSLKDKIKNIFAPPSVSEVDSAVRRPVEISPDQITANEILSVLTDHFRKTIRTLSTDYNFLFHTSFTIYIKATNYAEISDSFPFLAKGAEKKLVKEIRDYISSHKLKNYAPHSEYWQFQLVEIPPMAELEGETIDEDEDSALVQISSTLFPPSDEKEQNKTSGRIVTTVKGVNTLRQIRNCINPEILNQIYLFEKDRIKLIMRIDDKEPSQTSTGAKATPAGAGRPALEKRGNAEPLKGSPAKPGYTAKIVAEDGEIIENGMKIHTVAITRDEVHITGRSAMPGSDTVQIVKVDSDRVLTPHFKIRRDPDSGKFSYSVLGDAIVNQRTLKPDPNSWKPLPNNSTIILADEFQFKFLI